MNQYFLVDLRCNLFCFFKMSSAFLFDLFLFVCAVIEVPARGFVWLHVLSDMVIFACAYQYYILNLSCACLTAFAVFDLYRAYIRYDAAAVDFDSKWFGKEH